MDTLKTTVTEDALGKDVKHPASSGACEMNATEKPDNGTSLGTTNEEIEKKADREEADDLLQKIEEVVKDKVTSEYLENDISQSSEHDFIKKIEEMENEVNEAQHDEDLSKDKEYESEKVVVGKLVLEVSADEKTGAADSNGDNELNAIVDGSSKEVTEVKKDEDKVLIDEKDKSDDKGESSVGELKPSEVDGCNEAEATGEKDEKGKADESSNKVTGSKTKDDKEAQASDETNTVPQKSLPLPDKLVKTKDEKKIDENIPSEETASTSSEKVSEEVSSTSSDLITTVKAAKQVANVEKPEVREIIPSESEKKEEPMSVDSCDPLMEPMDVDSEEKMDVDPETADDACDINDEEMTPVGEVPQKLDVNIAINEAEPLKPADSSKTILQAKVSNTEKGKHEEETIVEDKSPVKSNVELKETGKEKQDIIAKKTDETQVVDAHPDDTISKGSEKLPVNESPVSSTTTDMPPKAKASAAAADLGKVEPRENVSTSVPVEKSTKTKNEQSVDAPVSTTEITKEVTKLPDKVGNKVTQVEQEKDACIESEPKCKTSPLGKNPIDGKVPDVKNTEIIEIISIDSEESREETEAPEKEEVVISEKAAKEAKVEKKQENESEDVIAVEEEKHDEKIEKSPKSDSDIRSGTKIEKNSKDNLAPSKIGAEQKEQLSSDSTVSLSSTAEDEIVKFSLETTLPCEDLEPEQPLKKIENKPLLNMMKHGGSTSSLDTTPVITSNVFNSTPIQKQFEISSENVSKISEGIDASRSEKTVEDDGNLNKSSKPEYSTESGTTCTSTSHQSSTEHHSTDHQESEHQSSDGVAKYINIIKKYNGITDLTNDDDESTTNVKIPLSQLGQDIKKDSLYEINAWLDKNDIKFLSVQKVEVKKISAVLLDKSERSELASSSNGSVTSLPPFNLPLSQGSRLSEVSSSCSGTQNTLTAPSSPNKFKIQGISQLCNFMIDEFTKIKKSLHPEELSVDIPQETKDILEEPTTPKSQNKEPTKKNLSKGKSASPTVSELSPSTRAEKRSRKRSFNKSPSQEEDEGKSKAKQPRKSQGKSHGTPSKEIESLHSDLAGHCVLAKWIDKKFYAGKISGEKPGNKFVVLFEDGASKVLPKESIVFGEEDSLPLKDCSVHALVDDDYECGVVLSIDKVDNKILYTVKAESKTVQVAASDIYLEDDQAKAIQNMQNAQKQNATTASPDEFSAGQSRPTRNKRASTSPVTPEPGFSGGVKKGAKRQKRTPSSKLNRISESSDITDTPESSPASPETSLDLVEGLQPELQKTEKEAELCKMIFMADYSDFEPKCNPQEMLGRLPTLKTLFKNKCFLLTCSVGLKPHRFDETDDVNKKNRQFSKVPYVKNYLQKQIEDGGGTVYNHFEDIPKSKYRQCKLIAPRPCVTAKYIHCLAADIQAISHEWIIDSCNKNILQDHKKYILPSGWSLLIEKYIRWTVGKASDQRQSNQPFNKVTVLIASEHNDFVTFWSRVCKTAGATVRIVKFIGDITKSTKGYMVTDLDFPQIIRSKASHFGIPVVSTVWIVQSLIMGTICSPDSSPKFTQIYPDDDYF